MYQPRPPRRLRRSVRRHRWRRRIGLFFLLMVGFVISGMVGAGVYFLPAIEVAAKDLNVQGTPPPQPATPTPGTSSSAASASPTDTPLGTPDSSPMATLQPVDNSPPAANQPFTILLLGSDSDAKFTDGSYLTQSMILARVDPVAKQVTMLSISRDMYVRLCNGYYDKIDKAYSIAGARCAIQTVQNDFHVHIDYYAWIGLQGLVTLVDQVGGVNVVASNPVMDDYYPADLSGGNPYDYDRILVLPGAQHMSGNLALQYVRARHDDLQGDFGRSIRQQQILIALRAKSKQLTLGDIPDIASAMQNYFKTDMSITDVSGLLPIAGSVPLSSITQVVLLPPYTSSQQIGDQDVLMPNWYLIWPEVSKYFP